MDLLIAIGLLFAFILGPILWRSRGTNKRRLVEKAVWILFLGWLLFALKSFL
jgi:hypothetical protein